MEDKLTPQVKQTTPQAGFGYEDALDVEKKEAEWIIQDVLPKGFGYIAGPPKASNSPDGGKSILSREMAVSIDTGQPFLGVYSVKKRGQVLMLNLDEMMYRISESVIRLGGGCLGRGLKISKAHSVTFPRDIGKLEADIADLKPVAVFIDPFLRIVGGKDINNNSGTGPVIDCLKDLQRRYDLCMSIIHHSIKNPERDKNSTASWLSGSTDLDSSWDFCLCLDWDRKEGAMHLISQDKYEGRKDIYYKACKNADDKIIDLSFYAKGKRDVRVERIKTCLFCANKTVKEMEENTKIKEATLKRILQGNLNIFEIKGRKGNANLWSLKPQNTVQRANEQENHNSSQNTYTEGEQT